MKISQDVLKILDQSACHGIRFALPPIDLDRKLYLDVAKVIEAAGGKWNRKEKCHIFPDDAADLIEPIILTGEVASRKQEFGQFFTPDAVGDRLIELAEIEPGMTMLEPSAGDGALVVKMLDTAPIKITYCEVDPKNMARIGKRLETYVPRSAYFGEALTRDFLSLSPHGYERVDRVVMNPPFAKRADVKHVLHAAKFLGPDGLLVSVMSAGVLFRRDALTESLRLRIAYHETLPEDSFKESGTSVNTCIVTLRAGSL